MLSSRSVSTLARRAALRRVAVANNATKTSKRFGSDMPVPNSMKARLWEGHPQVEEGWEKSIYFYYGVSLVSIIAILNFSPDTSIEAWAQNEARARLKLKDQGFTDFEFGKHYQNELMNEEASKWDKFTTKAIKPGEDDDDDEDEDEEDVSVFIDRFLKLCFFFLSGIDPLFFLVLLQEDEEEDDEGDDDDDE